MINAEQIIAELSNEIYLLNDQPTTCPKCGTRTEAVLDISSVYKYGEVQQCLNRSCKKQFITTAEEIEA